jgi:flagellar biosynthesis anti-sigma factor FlgM
MKLHDPNLSGAGLNAAERAQAAQAQAAPERARSRGADAPGGGDATDGIQVSGLARQLQALGAESPEREARVERLARQYERGDYRVDPETTAKSILDDALRS